MQYVGKWETPFKDVRYNYVKDIKNPNAIEAF